MSRTGQKTFTTHKTQDSEISVSLFQMNVALKGAITSDINLYETVFAI